jgi:hypothetical protein
MNLEQALLAALGAVCAALGGYVKHERDQSAAREAACLKRNDELEARVAELQGQVGEMRGRLTVIELCPVQGCPLQPSVTHPNHHD